MKKQTLIILAGASLITAHVPGQAILFDFDNAPVHTSLPIALAVGGITAQFSATGQGYSIQPANSLGFTPAGFAGNCVYPNSIYAADLMVAFSQPVSEFSILYSPQELGCDSSARMRVSAYLNGAYVGTATTNASVPGTWPTETLAFSRPEGFDRAVVHYDAPPACQDIGWIFLADNMRVTPAPPPIVLVASGRLANGWFQFSFTNTPATAFSVFATTNLSAPFNTWTRLGTATEVSSGQYRFTDLQTATSGRCFYRVTSP